MKQTEIERLLPAVYQRSLTAENPLLAILSVMEGMHDPAEDAIERVHDVFDPLTAPDVFLPMISRWVDLDRYLSSDHQWLGRPGWLRLVIANAADLARWRGTAAGLSRFLTLATGTGGFVVEDTVIGPTGALLPFHLRIRVPAAAAGHLRLVQMIVETEKPAYVTYDIVVEEQA